MSGADAIAVVVVTYNSAPTLPALAGSLASQLRDGDQLVIVDNASVDGTAELARSLPGPAAMVIEAGANRGFAAACRIGVDATADAADRCCSTPTRWSARAPWSGCARSRASVRTGRRGSRR